MRAGFPHAQTEPMDILILQASRDLAAGNTTAGLRQLDGLLVDICDFNNVNNNKARPPSSVNGTGRYTCEILFQRSKTRQFLELQENPVFNVASIVANSLVKIDTPPQKMSSEQQQQVLTMLDVVQGSCLLHYSSRAVFSSELVMQSVLRLVDWTTPQAIQLSGISTLVSILVHNVRNIRLLEQLGGIGKICSLFKQKDTSKDVKLRILEFLFFYLIPESTRQADAEETNRLYERRSTRDKQEILGKYLSNVTNLVREFETSKPFGEMAVEW